jgi:hypothetical protein
VSDELIESCRLACPTVTPAVRVEPDTQWRVVDKQNVSARDLAQGFDFIACVMPFRVALKALR